MLCFVLSYIFLLIAFPSHASTKSYLVTQGFEGTYSYTTGYVFFYQNTVVNYQSGDIVLSSTPDGTGDVNIGDAVKFGVQPTDSALPSYFTHYGEEQCIIFHPSSAPLNITHLFMKGKQHNVGVYLMNWCSTKKTISPLYIVNINIKDTPPPTPFLDLPWDYKAKNMSFTDAALSMASYFDHEYPLLSSGLKEPEETSGSIIQFKDITRRNFPYSSHDGYDYSNIAQVHIDEPILSAAEGYASYINSCSACGNMIVIDHQNGYQTRYMHMQKDGLIVATPNQKVWVNTRQIIGKVGATGNVWPQGVQGAHIHFGVVSDKNHDGNFSDNIPDGMIDPFGWQSKNQDPWETYSFFLNDQEKQNNISRTGSKSSYLWTTQLLTSSATLGKNGGLFGFAGGRYSLNFPAGAVSQDLIISLSVEPITSEPSAQLRPIGAGLVITVTDLLGNIISSFTKHFTLQMVYKGLDTTDIDTNSIAIYSSQDGLNWNKELTTHHDTTNQILSAQLNHLTSFALMAQRKDTISPTTHSTLTGDTYMNSTYLSSTLLTLSSQDNQGGMGVEYTLVKDNTHDWDRYTTPLTYTDEGHHTIQYYSVDKGWNTEKVQTISFDIISTIPTATPSPTLSLIPSSTPTPTMIPTNTPPPTISTSQTSFLLPTSTHTPTPIPTPTPTLLLSSIAKNSVSSLFSSKPMVLQHTGESVLGVDQAQKTDKINKKDFTLFAITSFLLFLILLFLFIKRKHIYQKNMLFSFF